MMKKISFLIMIALSVFIFNSCEDDEIGTEHIDYVSFGLIPSNINVIKNSSTSIDLHLYATQITNSDRVFNIVVSDDTTLDPLSYSLPSTIVVPANSNDGKITVVFSDNNLGENPESFGLSLEPVSDVLMGNTISTSIQKACPAALEDLVGSFSVTTNTSGYENDITTQLSGEDLTVFNLAEGIMEGAWGEPITDGGSFKMTVDLDTGTLTIPRQYFVTTVYDGDNYTYEIIGSGSWNNCGSSPTLDITYDVYYTDDETGIGNDYFGAAFGGVFTLDQP